MTLIIYSASAILNMPYVKQHLAEFIQEKESLLQLKSNKENSRSSPYLSVSDQSRSKGNRYCATSCKINHVAKQCMYIRAVPEMTKWGGRAAIDFFLCGWSYFFNIYFLRGWAVEKIFFVGHWSILIFFLCNAGI